MSELYDRITSQPGSLERLIKRIPGFAGYLDKKARRTADRLLRDHIADELTRRIDRLAEIEKTILDNGGLSYMSKTSSAKTKLQHFRDLVKTAAPGYSGIMEAIKIGPDEMDKLYSFDEALIAYADKFDGALNTLAKAAKEKTGIDEAIAGLDALTIEANDAFTLRDDVLTNLSKSV
ncbi:MAG: hypothetical protein GC179_03650 [Anaerolineaceae bacterium]|nr:hypothetical protein [Anaerolineaceae bacterium]